MSPNCLVVTLIISFLFICLILVTSIFSLIYTNKHKKNYNYLLSDNIINPIDIKINPKFFNSLNSGDFKYQSNIELKNILYSDECATDSLPYSRILGGRETLPNKYPWMVSLRLFRNQNLYDHFCAGVLISNTVVMTAAHCVAKQTESELLAVLGLYYRQDISEYATNNTYSISKIILHENSTENDIALLILSKHVNIGANIKPICLPVGLKHDIFYGYEAYVAGWGLKSLNEPSNKLQHARMNLLNNSDSRCSKYLKDSEMNNLYCALESKGNNTNEVVELSTICSGDSGGPLFVLFKNKWILLGIVSFVQTFLTTNESTEYFCDPTLPSFYTNVPFYLDWINSTLNKKFN